MSAAHGCACAHCSTGMSVRAYRQREERKKHAVPLASKIKELLSYKTANSKSAKDILDLLFKPFKTLLKLWKATPHLLLLVPYHSAEGKEANQEKGVKTMMDWLPKANQPTASRLTEEP
ncbi:hypothetical protein HispidOSU_024099 [Sigmodon hispidus]